LRFSTEIPSRRRYEIGIGNYGSLHVPGVQGCMPGTPVSGWSDTRIHSRRHPTRYEQWLPSATLSRRQDIPRSTDAQQLRRSKLQCCRPARVEQFTAATATRHELCASQSSTENISIWELVNHGALW